MKRSIGYFCKQSNVLEETEIKRLNAILVDYLHYIEFAEYIPNCRSKARWRLIIKLLKRETS